ncbi:hypothetical protein [Sphingomonas sp. CCH9-F2]|uniref:hypothetical protein n=1 Tax=Sphingomonas sp. CCH9-F2 TaxID=1768778 RepID=UPI0012E35E2C|nr:hypothetical protein [Sphingomonas sp. CCH9-F2]
MPLPDLPVRDYSFRPPQPLRGTGIEHHEPATGCRRADMKQIFPLVLAIVPLVAVLGACVAVP